MKKKKKNDYNITKLIVRLCSGKTLTMLSMWIRSPGESITEILFPSRLSNVETNFWCQQKLLVTSVICCYFQITDDNSFWKIHCFTFFPYKSIRDQIWPCRKICQGQPRVIIWTNLVILEHPMLHTKFQGHRSFGSGEDDFLRFLPYMGMAAILVMWPIPFEQTFVPPSYGDSIWNLASIGPLVSEKMFEECGRRSLTRFLSEAIVSPNWRLSLYSSLCCFFFFFLSFRLIPLILFAVVLHSLTQAFMVWVLDDTK